MSGATPTNELRSDSRAREHWTALQRARDVMSASDQMPQLARHRRDGGPEQVLVVEDDDGVRRITARILVEAGFATALAVDGVEALEMVQLDPGKFDAVVTDIVMPRLDGVGLLTHLSRLERVPPVVLVSGYSPLQLEERGITPPCAVLRKPYEPERLIQAVRDCIDGRSDPGVQS